MFRKSAVICGDCFPMFRREPGCLACDNPATTFRGAQGFRSCAGLSQDLPQNGPLIVMVAEPLGADEEMLVPLTDAGENALHAMTQLTHHAEVPEHQDFETSLSRAHLRTAQLSAGSGVAVSTES
jgi:hypothetical protein